MNKMDSPRLHGMLRFNTDPVLHQPTSDGNKVECKACVLDYPRPHIFVDSNAIGCGGQIHADKRYDLECGATIYLAKRCDGCDYESFVDTTEEERQKLWQEERKND